MRFAFKITLLLFSITTVFVLLASWFFHKQLTHNFERQAEASLQQSTALIEQRIEFLRHNLTRELSQLSSSIFMENEDVLAALLKNPPEFSPAAISFAARLKKRTTLDVLTILSPDGVVLSDSLQPASFGTRSDSGLLEQDVHFSRLANSAALQAAEPVIFGRYTLRVRGAYLLKPRLQQIAPQGITYIVQEFPAGSSEKTYSASEYMLRSIDLTDDEGSSIMKITVAVSKLPLEQQKKRLVRDIGTFIAAALAICLVIGFILSHSITRPVGRLQEAAERMSAGDLDIRVEEEHSGEFAALTRAFNHMAEQLQENQRKLLHTERIAAWREIARHLAHEIKNPLTPIRTSIANLRLSLQKAPEKFPAVFDESTISILEEVEKLRHLADEFARFARLPAPNLVPANLNEAIARSIQLYGDTAGSNGHMIYSEPGKQVEINFIAGDIPTFLFDPEQISEVLHNLLRNAVDAIESNGRITITTGTLQQADKVNVYLAMEDNGRGMDSSVQQSAFTPYFTTKSTGTGLGLPIVQRIITEHRGVIFLQSDPGKGSRFEIRFPIL